MGFEVELEEAPLKPTVVVEVAGGVTVVVDAP